VVDYAHTPDALKKVLLALNDIRRDDQHIITITGSGGDRDKTKRPKMARIAIDHSHTTVFTSDNPRTEDPNQIIQDMVTGLPPKSNYYIEPDRKEAIKKAIQLAKPGDVILVAGKGHENYQEINGKRRPFSDHLVLNELSLELN
jgi:UDP-N-acetylmuramoyl-L-alanyl-D-glutamate--2,6-diaminopimelate ligase